VVYRENNFGQALSWVAHAVFSTDGERIVTASSDRTARIWAADGTAIATLQGHEDHVNAAAFSPDGQRIVTASLDGTARVWSLAGVFYQQLVSESLLPGETVEEYLEQSCRWLRSYLELERNRSRWADLRQSCEVYWP
jgi:WD40 repeat protein